MTAALSKAAQMGHLSPPVKSIVIDPVGNWVPANPMTDPTGLPPPQSASGDHLTSHPRLYSPCTPSRPPTPWPHPPRLWCQGPIPESSLTQPPILPPELYPRLHPWGPSHSWPLRCLPVLPFLTSLPSIPSLAQLQRRFCLLYVFLSWGVPLASNG